MLLQFGIMPEEDYTCQTINRQREIGYIPKMKTASNAHCEKIVHEFGGR
jgi:hypothetical protein